MNGATKPAGASEASPPPARNPRPMTGEDMTTVKWIPMELLHRSPYQVRRETAEDVAALAADIQAHGLINPITVRRRSQGDGFEVVAGHRRWAAMRSVDPKAEVPCIILDVDDRTAEELLVAENFVRADLSIMEQAETVALLTEHGRTAEECGKVCRRSVRWAHRMRAIGGIGEPWRGFLHAAGLPYACALAVARLPEAVREDAWEEFWIEVGEDLGLNPEGDGWEALADAAGDWTKLKRAMAEAVDAESADLPDGLDLTTDRGARSLLLYQQADEGNGDRFDLTTPYTPLGGVFDDLHMLERAPFPCGHVCAKCAKRTDHAPDLFAEDDGRAQPARCLDADCWRRCVERDVRERVAAATREGAQPAETEARVNSWRSDIKNTWEEALKSAGGDASRVTPIVEMFDDPDDGPTGALYFRVADPATPDEEGGQEEPAPVWKPEPWEEWRPENPRWMPMLMGDSLKKAYFAAGRAVGAVEAAGATNPIAPRHALAGAGEDWFHILVRSLVDMGEKHAGRVLDDLEAVLEPADAKKLREARAVYAEARTHLKKPEADE